MAVAPVVNLTGERQEPKVKQKRERIQLLEERPKPNWFVRGRDQWGKTVWYVRLEITGLLPRLYGPFPSQHKGLLFLDQVVNQMTDLVAELSDHANRYIVNRPFFQRMCCRPIIEVPELAHRRQFKSAPAGQKGHSNRSGSR
jgi:hypothetical protein